MASVATFERNDFISLRPKVRFDGENIVIEFFVQGDLQCSLLVTLAEASRLSVDILTECKKAVCAE